MTQSKNVQRPECSLKNYQESIIFVVEAVLANMPPMTATLAVRGDTLPHTNAVAITTPAFWRVCTSSKMRTPQQTNNNHKETNFLQT
jgi:hypothetical protein